MPEVIAEASTYTTLEEDDVILMGTPGGVDVLSDGDHVAIEVDGVGRLEHDVAVR
ncbi:MAG: fumarylacetoacetate hydrolase family protein [Halobacteriales archaeon]|nr:fumarylacetoacetate hydrolase family protein [Halobacteriales archaeon]